MSLMRLWVRELPGFVNLQHVPYVSSAGLRSIMVAAKLAKSSKGEMRLC